MITLSSLAVRPLATLVSRPRPADGDRPPGRPGHPAAPRPAARPWPGREITSGGVTLHVRETPGARRSEAVYVHGLSGSATNWTDLAALLGTRADRRSPSTCPGSAAPARPPRSTTPRPAHADALLCFLAGRGRPVHLLGNSLGGAIALIVAARRPELVRTLTLVSPAMPDRRPGPATDVGPAARARRCVPGRIGERAAGRARRDDQPASGPSRWSGCASATRRLAPEHRLAEAAEEIDARGRQAWAQEAFERTAKAMVASWWRGESLWAAAARVQVPTLVVWGDRDRLVAPRLAARTRGRDPGARLLMLPGVGHVAQIEAPEAVARAVAGTVGRGGAGRWR